MQHLLQTISLGCFITPDLRQELINSFILKKIEKGTKILNEGEKANKLYFIESGTLHTYYHHEGKQISSWFYIEGQFVTSWFSFFGQKKSFEVIECLDDCTLYEVSYANYQKLIADSPAFGNFARLLAEDMLTFIDEFGKGWSFLSAKEKYDTLLSFIPDIELRVKLGYIASFLGISQETLSRLRAKK